MNMNETVEKNNNKISVENTQKSKKQRIQIFIGIKNLFIRQSFSVHLQYLNWIIQLVSLSVESGKVFVSFVASVILNWEVVILFSAANLSLEWMRQCDVGLAIER